MSRACACAALLQARASLAREPALPGSRSLATYRRALFLVWGQIDRTRRSRAKGHLAELSDWTEAEKILKAREGVA